MIRGVLNLMELVLIFPALNYTSLSLSTLDKFKLSPSLLGGVPTLNLISLNLFLSFYLSFLTISGDGFIG